MKRIFGAVLAFALAFTTGCSPAAGYENAVAAVCRAMQTGDVKNLAPLFDRERIKSGLEAFPSEMAADGPPPGEFLHALLEQKDFSDLCHSLTAQFGNDYTVAYSNVRAEDSGAQDLAGLKRLQNLENTGETDAQREFLNSFASHLSDIKTVKASIILKNKTLKNTVDMTFVLYCLDGQWYLDHVNCSAFFSPNLLSVVSSALAARAQ